jgi:hypothetical protein
MRKINPPAPPKPSHAFLVHVEQRTGLVWTIQRVEALERMWAAWLKVNGGRGDVKPWEVEQPEA